MVRLPATVCKYCQADLRTGERPEEKIPIWKARGFKTLVVTAVLVIPITAYAFFGGDGNQSLITRVVDRINFGLRTCAEPVPMWERDDKTQDRMRMRQGYQAWSSDRKTRIRGQNQYSPDENELSSDERFARRDKRKYYADTMMTDSPSERIDKDANWYADFTGEWDVAWITGTGTARENAVTGEWNFTWVNGGEALEDILNVPYLWEMANSKNPIRITSIRTYNSGGYWEGARVLPGRILPFRSGRGGDGSIYETYSNNQGYTEHWIFSNISATAFRVMISETRDNGQTYNPVAEIWAKSRVLE